MISTTQDSITLRESHKSAVSTLHLITVVTTVLAARILMYSWLYHKGYFYGVPWDTFSRTFLSFEWARDPYFFTPGGGYWLPFQFWITGFIYRLIGTDRIGTDIIIPVIVNNAFFLGSIIILYYVSYTLFDQRCAMIACFLATILAQDIFVSFSGLSEPIWIFLILLAALYIQRYLQIEHEKYPVLAIKISLVTAILAFTHYIGWFLIIVVCLLFAYDLLHRIKNNGSPKEIVIILLAGCISVIVPVIWLAKFYITVGDFLYPFHAIKTYEQLYIGQLSIFERLISFVSTLLSRFPLETILGMGTIVMIYWKRENRKALFFIIGPLGILMTLWMTTIMSLSSPFRETRYYLFWIWTTFPVIAFTLRKLWNSPNNLYKGIAALLICGYIFNNANQLIYSRNSFGVDVRSIAEETSFFLEKSDKNKVILETTSFAEQTVIPITGKYFWEYEHVTTEEILQNSDDLSAYFKGFAKNWLGVIKSDKVANRARTQGLDVNQIGSYYLISP